MLDFVILIKQQKLTFLTFRSLYVCNILAITVSENVTDCLHSSKHTLGPRFQRKHLKKKFLAIIKYGTLHTQNSLHSRDFYFDTYISCTFYTCIQLLLLFSCEVFWSFISLKRFSLFIQSSVFTCF